MSAKKQITKEYILNKAFQLVEERGMDELNVRSLAKMCVCSTQPIYLSFSGMDELKRELHKKIIDTYESFVSDKELKAKYPEYKARGVGYINFAKNNPNLFKYLFLNTHNDDSGLTNSLNTDISTIMKNYSVQKPTAEKIAVEMWVAVHGIATMCATNVVNWDEETISTILTDLFKGVISNGGN